jgi:DNA polymerase III epsilon subunit-like protein
MRKLLVIDTETGGLDASKHAIISLAAVVYNDGPEATFHRYIKDAEGLTTEEAFRTNQIPSLVVHEEGKDPWTVVQELHYFLAKNQMDVRITLAGHNLPFDIAFLQRLYRLAGEDYDKVYHHGGLDTKSAALVFEQAALFFPRSSSLVDVAPAFGVTVKKAHDALADAYATAQVLEKMITRLRRS